MPTLQNIFGGWPGAPNAGSTTYNSLMGGNTFVATEGERQGVIPTNGNISNLQVSITTAPGAGKSWTITLMLNGATTGLTTTIADTNTLSSLATSEITVAAGDTVSLQFVPSGTPTGAVSVYYGSTFSPTTDGETIWIGNSAGNNLVTANYHNAGGSLANQATEWYTEVYLPTPGTFKNLYVKLSAAPTSTNSRTFSMRENNATQTLAVTITGANTTGNNNNTFTSVATDRIALLHAVSGTPTASYASWGVVFVPTTSGEYCVPFTTYDTTNISATEYASISGSYATLGATESGFACLCSVATTFKHMRVRLELDPGTVNQDAYTFTLRRNLNTNTSLAVTITANNTTGNTTSDVSISAQDLLTTSILPVNTPSVATRIAVSYYGYNAPTGRTVSFRRTLLGAGR